MPHASLLIPPSATFWPEAARALLDAVSDGTFGPVTESFHPRRLTALQVVVPSVHHIPLLKAALAARLEAPFAAPSITTLSAWLAMQPPDDAAVRPTSASERLLTLYAGLRQHAWLKTMFAARRNTDLLPLAQTLVALSDELTCAMLPSIQQSPGDAEALWQTALAQLPAPARKLLSEETELVWSVWKSQLDQHDPLVRRFAQMQRLAKEATHPLAWIGATEADPFDQAFLATYRGQQPVMTVMPDWRTHAVEPAYAVAWPEVCDGPAGDTAPIRTPSNGMLYPAKSLEDEALIGARTVLDWLAADRNCVAIVAQDRVVSRRARALLERAGVLVTDETGWKLSTTRAAASVAAWFDVVASRAGIAPLLDLLKSPFVLPQWPDKTSLVMMIELTLRRMNIGGGWRAILSAVAGMPEARELLTLVAEQAMQFNERRTLPAWLDTTRTMLNAMGLQQALAEDEAGRQVLAVIDASTQSGDGSSFTFSEWRTFLCMQLEATNFIAAGHDRRVVMLPLAETRLRRFDAVLVLGSDAAHLPAQAADQLFFANAVRRELGLSTRESRHRQQMRDLAALLSSGKPVVLSWQAWRKGEANPVSPWIERLQLALQHGGAGSLALHDVSIAKTTLAARPPARPAPVAPQRLPDRLSASAYGKLLQCPYQFFALHMLGLSTINELSDIPEKRDYGDWLHDILNRFHEQVRDNQIPVEQRQALLTEISEQVFGSALQRHGAALGYYARWQGAMPAYLAWANEREGQGWRYVSGECRLEKTLAWPGGQVTLHGRIDRIDEHDDGSRAVLDYKTNSQQDLRKRLKDAEDYQLGFYGILSSAGFSAAHYVALEPTKGKAGDAQAADYDGMQTRLETQILTCLGAIASGASLPANGIETVCQYCDVRGLCRKGSWA
jgi:ATP-dependent helicase/nuclease subunit B